MKVPFAGKKVRVTDKLYPKFWYDGYLVPGSCPGWEVTCYGQQTTYHIRDDSGAHLPVFTTDRVEVIQ